MFYLMSFFLSYKGAHFLYDFPIFWTTFLRIVYVSLKTFNPSFPSCSIFHKKNLIREHFCIGGIGDISPKCHSAIISRSIACIK